MHNTNSNSVSGQKQGRMVFWLILLCFIIPAGLAGILYWNGLFIHSTKKNHGELLHPPLALDVILPSALKNSLPSHKWLILFSQAASCDEVCHTREYELGQIKKALGKNSYRVVVQSFSAQSMPVIKPTNDNAVWIVDPKGNVILYYSATTTSKYILEDLRYVLKLSQIG
jgi:cytochrome oxidase Cu insertion factor (SCO1/SenC/PrrC family)